MLSLAIFAVSLGAIVGGFLNVVVHRVPRAESLIRPGSRCPACAVPIPPHDNLPVVSWLLLRGRCRSCAEPISARYPFVEILTAVVFALIVAARGFDDALILQLPFAALLIAVAFIDYDHRIVPNKIVRAGTIYAIGATLVLFPDELPERLFAGGAAFALPLLAALIHPAGMGMGDVKLTGVTGLFLGVATIPALFVAFIAGAFFGIVQMVRQGLMARKSGLPFAPFLALGGLVGVIGGPELIDQYSRAFL